MESSPATHCHHVRTSGLRCGSLALRNKRYCYYHQRTRPAMVNFAEPNRQPVLLSLPLFEDAHAIQVTLHSVVYHLLEGHIGQKTAGLLLYAMQMASSNLKHIKAETPDPEQVVVDLPKLSEIPSPEPSRKRRGSTRIPSGARIFPTRQPPRTSITTMSCVRRANSASNRRTSPMKRFPRTYRPICAGRPRLSRVISLARKGEGTEHRYIKTMEKFNFNGGNGRPGSKPPETQASNKPPGSNPQEKKATTDKSAPGKLPPGTIHGCGDGHTAQTEMESFSERPAKQRRPNREARAHGGQQNQISLLQAAFLDGSLHGERNSCSRGVAVAFDVDDYLFRRDFRRSAVA